MQTPEDLKARLYHYKENQMKKLDTKYIYTYGYDVTKETYPERIERAKKEKSLARMVMQLLATVRLPMV